MFFALFLYNESVMISSLNYNVFIHINFQCLIHIKLKLCYGITPISVNP